MIFPGMDPYLEHPLLWPGLHASLIVYIRNQLQPQLRPRYIASIEERVYLQGTDEQRVPDVWVQRAKRGRRNGRAASTLLEADVPLVVHAGVEEVHERYVAILDLRDHERLVTVIEVVSPSNKRPGEARDSYRAKQREVWQSDANLVEVDLLRTGKHVLLIPEKAAREQAGSYHYLSCVNRAVSPRDSFDLYASRLPDRLPRINVPLAGQDDAVLDIQEVVNRAYEDAAYDLRLNYRSPCVPPMSKKDQAWANQLIRAALKSS